MSTQRHDTWEADDGPVSGTGCTVSNNAEFTDTGDEAKHVDDLELPQFQFPLRVEQLLSNID